MSTTIHGRNPLRNSGVRRGAESEGMGGGRGERHGDSYNHAVVGVRAKYRLIMDTQWTHNGRTMDTTMDTGKTQYVAHMRP